jgi:hypothetical protein
MRDGQMLREYRKRIAENQVFLPVQKSTLPLGKVRGAEKTLSLANRLLVNAGRGRYDPAGIELRSKLKEVEAEGPGPDTRQAVISLPQECPRRSLLGKKRPAAICERGDRAITGKLTVLDQETIHHARNFLLAAFFLCRADSSNVRSLSL